MSDVTTENTKEFEILDKVLSDSIDCELLKELNHYLDIVKAKSRALSSSLKRCFENAKNSRRYLLVYKLGKKDAQTGTDIKDDIQLRKYLEDFLKDYFEKNDFMHYREFVRLNRACAIDVGIEVSSKIKDMYNEFFTGKRLTSAYKIGLYAAT